MAFEEHSWFPGYAWRLAVCPQCGAHVGWSFETPHQSDRHDSKNRWQHSHDHVKEDKSSKKPYSFVGLIYPNLIQEHYADSLIITPKAYKSWSTWRLWCKVKTTYWLLFKTYFDHVNTVRCTWRPCVILLWRRDACHAVLSRNLRTTRGVPAR